MKTVGNLGCLQSGQELSDENAAAALDSAAWLARHGRPLPPPRIQLKSAAAQAMVDKVHGSPFSSRGLPGSAAPLPASPPSRNPFGGASPPTAIDVGVLGDMVARVQQPAAAAPGPSSGALLPPQPPQQEGEEDVDDDLFGLKKLKGALPQQPGSAGPPRPAAEAAADRSRSPSPMKRLTRMSEMSGRKLDLYQSASRPGGCLSVRSRHARALAAAFCFLGTASQFRGEAQGGLVQALGGRVYLACLC